jgi:hypothetical protein
MFPNQEIIFNGLAICAGVYAVVVALNALLTFI